MEDHVWWCSPMHQGRDTKNQVPRKVNRQPENSKNSLNFLPCRQMLMQEKIYCGLNVSAIVIAYAVLARDLEGPCSAGWKYHSFSAHNPVDWNIPWTREKCKIGEQRLYSTCIMMWLNTIFTHQYKYHYAPCVATETGKYWHTNITFYVFLIFCHAFITFWWTRSINSYQWLMALSLERTYKQTLVRQWRIATHMPFMSLHYTNHSCLHTRSLFHVSYSHYSSTDLGKKCILRQ